jgi:hypothetical protein
LSFSETKTTGASGLPQARDPGKHDETATQMNGRQTKGRQLKLPPLE